MSEPLAYLVIDRAPLRGTVYWALLYVAMAANERDVTYASGRSVAMAIRVRVQRAQEALGMLCQDGYLKRLRYGQAKNRYSGYYIVLREKLMALPTQDPGRRAFAGKKVEEWEEILTEETAGMLAERAAMLDEFLGLGEGEHLPFLRRMSAKNPIIH